MSPGPPPKPAPGRRTSWIGCADVRRTTRPDACTGPTSGFAGSNPFRPRPRREDPSRRGASPARCRHQLRVPIQRRRLRCAPLLLRLKLPTAATPRDRGAAPARPQPQRHPRRASAQDRPRRLSTHPAGCPLQVEIPASVPVASWPLIGRAPSGSEPAHDAGWAGSRPLVQPGVAGQVKRPGPSRLATPAARQGPC